jgi:hypothetical protein
MAKRKPKPTEPVEPPEERWEVFARIDPSLRAQIAKYIAGQKFKPTLAMVIEHAFRLLLEHEGNETG